MAVKQISQIYFMADSKKDLNSVPKKEMGIECYVIDEAIEYKMNSEGRWFPQKPISGGGGTGADGKSAYEIACDYGFEGTEEEWLESLKGEAPYVGENGNWFIEGEDTGIAPDNVNSLTDADLEMLLTQLD